MIPQRPAPAALLACLALAPVAAHSQAAGDTVLHLHGSVIDSLTGKPIPRALVKSGDNRFATMTNAEGHFAVDLTLPAPPGSSTASGYAISNRGTLFLTAEKPGFLATGNQTLVALDTSLSASNIELKLNPAASLSGQITSAQADSAANVRVSLLQRGIDDGERTWRAVSSQQTNSIGEFHFGQLQPGEYTVLAAEWRGDQPPAPKRNAITQQYPPDFLGDTPTLAGATRLQLNFGDSPQTQLHLHPVTYYPVTIPVSSNSPVNIRLGGKDTFGAFTLGYNQRDNAVEGSLPSGDYTLNLSSFGADPAFAVLPFHVASAPLRTAPVVLAPASSIPIRVQIEFTRPQGGADSSRIQGFSVPDAAGPPLPPVQVFLRSEDSNQNFFARRSSHADGQLSFEQVPPGIYRVRAQPTQGYVATLTSGGVNLFDHPLVVNPGGSPEPIDLILRDDTATLTGTVNAGSPSPTQTSYIQLLPADGSARYLQGFAGADGKFSIANVVPGAYRVLALRSPADNKIAFRDPKALAAFAGTGSTVVLTPGQTSTTEAPLLEESQLLTLAAESPAEDR